MCDDVINMQMSMLSSWLFELQVAPFIGAELPTLFRSSLWLGSKLYLNCEIYGIASLV